VPGSNLFLAVRVLIKMTTYLLLGPRFYTRDEFPSYWPSFWSKGAYLLLFGAEFSSQGRAPAVERPSSLAG
jgi:hypothetical protein